MPRFSSNRWWIFILTVVALNVVCLTSVPRSVVADTLRYGDWSPADDSGGGLGLPTPLGVGDPDQPSNTGLKYDQRGSLRSGNATLSSRPAGDSRVASNVWMIRLLVIQRVIRSYLYRY